MYNLVSITNVPDGAGCPTPKHPTVVLVPVDQIKSEPTRELGNVVCTGVLTLNETGKSINIYAQPSTVELTEETDGDAGARGVKCGLAFEHPGDSEAIGGFSEYARNKGFVALVRDCEGAGTVHKYIGSVCNPLYLSAEYTNNKDARKRKFTFKQEMRDVRGIGTYKGALPAAAAEAVESSDPEKEGA